MYILTEAASDASITTVLNTLGTIATFILEKVVAVVDIVMSQPLLLIPIGVVLLRTVISVFRSLF